MKIYGRQSMCFCAPSLSSLFGDCQPLPLPPSALACTPPNGWVFSVTAPPALASAHSLFFGRALPPTVSGEFIRRGVLEHAYGGVHVAPKGRELKESLPIPSAVRTPSMHHTLEGRGVVLTTRKGRLSAALKFDPSPVTVVLGPFTPVVVLGDSRLGG